MSECSYPTCIYHGGQRVHSTKPLLSPGAILLKDMLDLTIKDMMREGYLLVDNDESVYDLTAYGMYMLDSLIDGD